MKNKKKLARTGLIYAVLGIAMMAVSVKSSNGYYEPAHVIPIVQSEPSPGPDIQLASLSEQPVTTLAPASKVVGPDSYKSAAIEVVALGKAAISKVFDKKPEAPETASLDPTQPADTAGDLARHIVRVKRGDTLMDILLRAGVPGDEAEQAVSSMAEIFNPRKLQAGQDVTLIFGPADSVAVASRYA